MAFLKLTAESEATGALKRLYDAARSRAGYVANIIKLMSRDAPTAEASIPASTTSTEWPKAWASIPKAG